MRRATVFGLLAAGLLLPAQIVVAQPSAAESLPPPAGPLPGPPAMLPGQPASTEIRYLIAGIEVRGNRRTDTSLILDELGISLGDVLTPDDPRVPLAELHLRALGYFVRSQLRLERFA